MSADGTTPLLYKYVLEYGNYVRKPLKPAEKLNERMRKLSPADVHSDAGK